MPPFEYGVFGGTVRGKGKTGNKKSYLRGQ